LAVLPLLLFSLQAYAGTLEVHMLDVGQGDAILLRTPAGKTVLVDAGVLKGQPIAQLKALGVTHLDLVVASHPHADHIGGMPAVLQAFTVGQYTDSGQPHSTDNYQQTMTLIEEKGIPWKAAQVGQTYNLDDGIKIEVLHPGMTFLTNTRSDLNSNSVVLRVTHGQDCMLFVGDAEAETESALLQRGLSQCSLLKVAHHGSNHSSTDAFLDAVEPEYALVSVGADNRYGHPGAETVRRLESRGTEVHRTDLEGALRVESTGKGMSIQAQKLAPKVLAGATRLGGAESTPAAPTKAPAVAAVVASTQSVAATSTKGSPTNKAPAATANVPSQPATPRSTASTTSATAAAPSGLPWWRLAARRNEKLAARVAADVLRAAEASSKQTVEQADP
jgi:competence protein ComEC